MSIILLEVLRRLLFRWEGRINLITQIDPLGSWIVRSLDRGGKTTKIIFYSVFSVRD